MNPFTPEDFKAIQGLVAAHKKFQFKVVSDSMQPVLDIGTLVTLEPIADLSGLQRFDIVVFGDRGALTCHFVWTHNRLDAKPTITTRSLKFPGTDDVPIGQDSLLGRVTSHRITSLYRWRVILANLWTRNF